LKDGMSDIKFIEPNSKAPPEMRPNTGLSNEEGAKSVGLCVDSHFVQRFEITVPHCSCSNQFVPRCIGCIEREAILALPMNVDRD
jgi:hypothetical protein